MKTIPTAKEFLKEKGIDNELVEELLISFAKLHLQAQRKEIEKEAKVELSEDWVRKEETIHPNSLISSITVKVHKQSILNAYSDKNIK